MTPELGTPSQPDILVNRGALVGVHIGIPRSQSPLHRLPAIIDTGAQLAYYVASGRVLPSSSKLRLEQQAFVVGKIFQ